MSLAIEEKLTKEKEKLEILLEKKRSIELKIQKVQSNINNYDSMIKQKAFDETSEILSGKNITLAMVNDALKSGNLTLLQKMLDEANNSTKTLSENEIIE